MYGTVGIDRTFRQHHNLRLDFSYNATAVIDNPGRYTSKSEGIIDPSNFTWKQFGSGVLTYSYNRVNDKVLPTKGVSFQVQGSYTQNLKERDRYVSNASSSLNVYLPLVKPFSLAVKTGAATLTGRPELYQYNTIGGFYSLRGFWRYRFYGTSSFYNQNELRWLPPVKGHLFSGRLGLLAFFDQGRVWQAGESSDKWHYGYGGGVMLVPFNKIAIAATYGLSEEGGRMNIRLGKFF